MARYLHILFCILCFLGGRSHAQEAILEESTTPNVIVIVADGFGLSEYARHNQLAESEGAAPWLSVETPHLDALRERSLVLRDFYATPESAPSRAAILTGRYPYRTGVIHSQGAHSMMAGDEVTIAEMLSAAGYRTGAYGSWQLGDHYPMRASDQGFQDALLHVPARNKASGDHRGVILYRNNREVEMKGKRGGIYTDALLRFLTTSRDHELPFFCYIVYDSLEIGKGSQDLDSQLVNEHLTELDENIGKVIERLTNLDVLEKTLILCTSDKGAAPLVGDQRERAQRGQVGEAGVRAPLWLTWPEELSSRASEIEQLASHIDIVPTLLEACQVGSVSALELDGDSLLPRLNSREEPPANNESYLVTQLNQESTPVKYKNFMIRKGPWKLMSQHHSEAPHRRVKEAIQLYNLQKDPKEKTNLANTQPEKFDELLNHYETWFLSVTKTREDQAGRPPIWLNRKSENPVVLTRDDRVEGGKYEGSPYYWKLDFQHGSRVDITVQRSGDEDVVIETCRVSLRESVWELPVSPGKSVLHFEALNLTRGKQDLRVEFIDPNGQRVDVECTVRLVHR